MNLLFRLTFQGAAIFLGLLVLAPGARALDLPTDIKLTNGFVMKDCQVVQWSNDSILVKYVGGTAPIRFENIDPDERKLFEDMKGKALRQQQAEQAHDLRATAVQQAKQTNATRQETRRVTRAQETAARIQQAIDHHQIALGMNMDTVRSVFGTPVRSTSQTGARQIDRWVYAGRGKDVHGNASDRIVIFTNGVVTSWRDGNASWILAHGF